MSTENQSTFWRAAGFNYLQFLSVSSAAVRNALKEPVKARATARASMSYSKAIGADGEKTSVTSLF